MPEANNVVVFSTLCEGFHQGLIGADLADIVAPVNVWLVRVASFLFDKVAESSFRELAEIDFEVVLVDRPCRTVGEGVNMDSSQKRKGREGSGSPRSRSRQVSESVSKLPPFAYHCTYRTEISAHDLHTSEAVHLSGDSILTPSVSKPHAHALTRPSGTAEC